MRLYYLDDVYSGEPKLLTREIFKGIAECDDMRFVNGKIREACLQCNGREKAKWKMMLPTICYPSAPDFEEYARYCAVYDRHPGWVKLTAKGKKLSARAKEFARPTGLVMVDLDHLDNPKETYRRLCRALADEGRNYREVIVVAHVTPSGEGLRLVVAGDKDRSYTSMQRYIAHLAGALDEFDEVCKDWNRPSYTVPLSYYLRIDGSRLFGEHENEPGYTNHEFGQWQRECAQYMLDFMDEWTEETDNQLDIDAEILKFKKLY